MTQQQIKFTVYWMHMGEPWAKEIYDMNEALIFMNILRMTNGVTAVTFCAENPNQVGKPGVDAVVDGKTPDGVEYTWVKRRDGGQ